MEPLLPGGQQPHSNPFPDTAMCEIEFDSGELEAQMANLIAKAVHAQVDDEGHTMLELARLSHMSMLMSITKEKKELQRTTKGWFLCFCQCKHGTVEWRRLVEVANNKIDCEPAFVWWVPQTLKERDRILNAVKKRHFRTFQKHGFETPKVVAKALEIDRENGNILWPDAIAKEMRAVRKAFDFLDDKDPDPVGHEKVSVHPIFDVKTDFPRRLGWSLLCKCCVKGVCEAGFHAGSTQ